MLKAISRSHVYLHHHRTPVILSQRNHNQENRVMFSDNIIYKYIYSHYRGRKPAFTMGKDKDKNDGEG